MENSLDGKQSKFQKNPFLYTLVRAGHDNQDLCFQRVRGKNPGGPGIWGMHLDIDDPDPAKVIILVETQTEREVIMDEINKAQTYFRKQIDWAQ